ncbi:MAG: hypothetical protein KAX13_04565, partial [Candidatus Krumholzibacteria bacterium]|nr:hypothetical protein [Candidatus Krumholzibacteria bacterium]
MSVLSRYSLSRLLVALLISGATVTGQAALTGRTGCTVHAQVRAPGSPTGISMDPAPRGYGDRWPLMFTWTRNKVNWWK